MIPRLSFLALALALSAPLAASAADPATPARAYFTNLHDGDHVKSPFLVQFGISGMDVAPAGSTAPNSGHFHLLVDAPPPAADPGADHDHTGSAAHQIIPNDPHHLHFGKGQTETTLTLPPGPHTLQLVMGDGLHRIHDHPVMSAAINVTVE